jgi:acetylornithine deacetylase/succinyl-diaminopimelate desuccinylase-like protein
MIGAFSEERFLVLHEQLATTSAPSFGEEPRARVLRKFLTETGVPSRTDAAGNLWVSLGPEGWDDAVVYDAHLDVVGQGRTPTVRREGRRLMGLGVADDTAAVAMLALLAEAILAQGISLKHPLHILFSVGEEGLGNLKGMRQLLEDFPRPPKLFVGFDLSLGTYSLVGLGSRRYRVAVTCPGGHSWGAFGAPNAIEQLVDFFRMLKESYAGVVEKTEELISFNIGTIKGGEGINSIAHAAEATLEFRSVSPALLQEMERRFLDVLRLVNSRPDVQMTWESIGERPAAESVQAERIEPLVRRLLEGIGEIPGHQALSTNINLPLSKGWPAICLGLCQCGQFHRDDEYLDLDSLSRGWKLLDRLSQSLVF